MVGSEGFTSFFSGKIKTNKEDVKQLYLYITLQLPDKIIHVTVKELIGYSDW